MVVRKNLPSPSHEQLGYVPTGVHADEAAAKFTSGCCKTNSVQRVIISQFKIEHEIVSLLLTYFRIKTSVPTKFPVWFKFSL
jgi:hypothetical protein